jgi:hypothetical protein
MAETILIRVKIVIRARERLRYVLALACGWIGDTNDHEKISECEKREVSPSDFRKCAASLNHSCMESEHAISHAFG